MPSIAAIATSSSKVRWIAIGISFLLAATIGNLADPTQARAQAPTAITAADTPPLKVTERPDLVSARVTARSQGSRVEVTNARTETSTTWVEPTGELTTDQATVPVRLKRGEVWVPVNLDLEATENGFESKASANGVRFSAGGDSAAVRLADGTRRIWLNWTKSLAAPSIEGPRATYALDANTDLVLTALPEGFEQSLVLKAPPAVAPKIHLPLDLTGLTVRDAEVGGGYEFVNSTGDVVFSTPKPHVGLGAG